MSGPFTYKIPEMWGPHYVAKIHHHESGWEVSVQHHSDGRPLIKNPKMRGAELVFPKSWGRKRGALELIRQRIQMDEEIIRDAAESIGKMLAVQEAVQAWPEDTSSVKSMYRTPEEAEGE